MKKFCTLFVIFFFLSCWSNFAFAEEAVVIVKIPDAALEVALRRALDLTPTAFITKQAMSRLTILNAEGEQPDTLPISDLTGLEHATQLETLILWRNWHISDLSPLAGLKKLRGLHLGANQISDLSPLAGLTQLERLTLYGNQISDLSPLAGLKGQRELHLSGNQISDLSPLAGLKQLGELHLSRNQISDLSPLADLKQLRWLFLADNQISDPSPLAGLTQLKTLDIAHNQIRDVNPLVALIYLEKLVITGNPIRDASPLANLWRLVQVDIDIPNQVKAGGVISDRHLASAVRAALHLTNLQPITKERMQGLRRLLITENHQVSSLAGLEYATHLEELVFNRTQIGGDLSPLANLTQLRRLDLGDSQINDISPLADLTNLTYLNLQSNQIRDISPLANLTQLQDLWLVYNSISDISPLANLTQLKRLGLFSNQISNVLPLTGLVNLETLMLGSNPIEDASPLAALPKLKDVDIEIPQPVEPADYPPIYWTDKTSGLLYRLANTEVEYLVSGLQNVTGFAVHTTAGRIYWTEQTRRNVGMVKSARLDGSNVKTLALLQSVPSDIVVDTTRKKLYWANSRGRIQEANLNGKRIRTLIRNLNSPGNIALDVAEGKLYWTEQSRHIGRANLNGSHVENIVSDLGRLGDITVFGSKLYWTEQTNAKRGKIRCADLDSLRIRTLATLQSFPISIDVDPVGRKLYWINSRGRILRANLKARRIQTIVDGLEAPDRIVLGTLTTPPELTKLAAAPTSVGSFPDKTVLFANYPNPFNPETWIPYRLADSSSVQITIYDARGIRIRHLKLGYQVPGDYTSKDRAAYWDGRNAFGERVASGVYFYQLRADGVSALRKMLILK